MNLSNAELLAILVSPVFVITATQVARKYIKALVDWKVALFVFILSEVVCISERMLTQPSQWAYGILAGLLLAIVCLGVNDKANELTKRVGLSMSLPLSPKLPTVDPGTNIDATEKPGITKP